MKTRLLLVSALMLPLLASCGLQKPLERPGPMWGDEKAAHDAEQARIKADREAAKADKPIAPSDLAPPPPPAPAPAAGNSPVDAPLVP